MGRVPASEPTDERAHRGRIPGDLRALLEYLGLGWDVLPGELSGALTQRRIRSWLADTLARGGARSTIARHTAAIRNFTAWAVREEILASDPAATLTSPRADQRPAHAPGRV